MSQRRAACRLLTIVLFLLALVIVGCRGMSAGPQPKTPGSAPTVAFSSSASSISVGDAVTLTWSTQNATSVSISPDPGAGKLPPAGSVSVKPTQSTTYTITATGAGGTASQSLTINVAQAGPPTVTLTATPLAIIAGQFADLSWSSTNATSITITPSVLGEDQTTLPLSGTKHVSLTQTTTYTATVTGPGGTASAKVTITVTPIQINFKATPDTITLGQSATLSWNTVAVNTLTIDNGVGDVSTKLPQGTATVTPTKTTTYTATATGPGGPVTQTAVVSVAPAIPKGTINHIIFMLQENRSFDNYFGKLGAYRAAKVSGATASDIDGFDPNVILKNESGISAKPYHYQTVCTENLTPAWDESHHDVHLQSPATFMDSDFSKATFLMDRFMTTTNSVEQKFDPNGTRTLGYYDQTDLPYYYELATQFATSDRFFSSLLANTNPNRMYMFTATSFGHAFPDPAPTSGWPQKTIFRAMNEAGVSWAYYHMDNSTYLTDFADFNDPTINGKVRDIKELFATLASPTADQDLPQVVFIERGGASGFDEHPDNNIQKGAAVVKNIIDTLMASAAWKSSAFILAYDEAGGLYDHVAPFQVPEPDNIDPILKPNDTQGRFNLSGMRVPMIVVSPWVKPHFVSHKNRELTSILKFIETRFNVPPLTKRDAAADDMSEFFDLTKPTWLTPPPLPAQPTNGLCDPSKEAGPTF